MQMFALTVFKAFPLVVLYHTARSRTVCIPPRPNNTFDRSVYTLHAAPHTQVNPRTVCTIRGFAMF